MGRQYLQDKSIYIDNTSNQTIGNTTNDIHIITPTDKTVVFDTPTYNDYYFSVIPSSGTISADYALMPNMTYCRAWLFNGGSTLEELHAAFGLPHDYKEGTDIQVHFNQCGTTNDAGDIKWHIAYSICMPGVEGAELSEEVVSSIIVANAGLGVNGRCKPATKTITIPGVGMLISATITIRFWRNPSDSEDTYTHDAVFLKQGIHYQVDCPSGSRTILTK
jgi:hypothetical protein